MSSVSLGKAMTCVYVGKLTGMLLTDVLEIIEVLKMWFETVHYARKVKLHSKIVLKKG
jgi:hypothetical protein